MYTFDFTRRLSYALVWGSIIAALVFVVTG
jgi:hypothetical protein